jgi:hypothetical protein
MKNITLKNTAKIMGISLSIALFCALIGVKDVRAYYVDPNYNYYNNNYNQSFSNLVVSCYVNSSSVPVNSTVTWQANVSGGNGYYDYRWDGTEYLYGTERVINKTYNTLGTKSASVTVTSNNQSVTVSCSNYVNITSENYNTYYNPSNNYNGSYYYNSYGSAYGSSYNPYLNGFQVSCYPDTSSTEVGSTVRWNSNVLGGSGNYTYAWTGTNGLSSNQSTALTSYSSPGTKSATLTVRNSNGQIITQACSGSVDIVNAETYDEEVVSQVRTVTVPIVVYPNNNSNNQYQNQSQPQYINNQNNNDLSANSLFSLDNVPWGWIVVLIILVLMFTIMYLIFNDKKKV